MKVSIFVKFLCLTRLVIALPVEEAVHPEENANLPLRETDYNKQQLPLESSGINTQGLNSGYGWSKEEQPQDMYPLEPIYSDYDDSSKTLKFKEKEKEFGMSKTFKVPKLVPRISTEVLEIPVPRLDLEEVENEFETGFNFWKRKTKTKETQNVPGPFDLFEFIL